MSGTDEEQYEQDDPVVACVEEVEARYAEPKHAFREFMQSEMAGDERWSRDYVLNEEALAEQQTYRASPEFWDNLRVLEKYGVVISGNGHEVAIEPQGYEQMRELNSAMMQVELHSRLMGNALKEDERLVSEAMRADDDVRDAYYDLHDTRLAEIDNCRYLDSNEAEPENLELFELTPNDPANAQGYKQGVTER